MNRFFSSPKFLAVATLAAALLGAATVAEARPDIAVVIGLQSGLQSGPAWVAPARGYLQPQPVYLPPRLVHVAPRAVYGPARWGGHVARHEWERERERAWRRHDRQERFQGRGRDRDDRGDHGDHGPQRGHRD